MAHFARKSERIHGSPMEDAMKHLLCLSLVITLTTGLVPTAVAQGNTEPEPTPAPVSNPDNDADNIPDADDACPYDAEDLNGYKDTDGCPDQELKVSETVINVRGLLTKAEAAAITDDWKTAIRHLNDIEAIYPSKTIYQMMYTAYKKLGETELAKQMVDKIATAEEYPLTWSDGRVPLILKSLPVGTWIETSDDPRDLVSGPGGEDLPPVAEPSGSTLADDYSKFDKTPTDRDGDGIPNKRDLCPDVHEDIDYYQDTDGCPDPGNDYISMVHVQAFNNSVTVEFDASNPSACRGKRIDPLGSTGAARIEIICTNTSAYYYARIARNSAILVDFQIRVSTGPSPTTRLQFWVDGDVRMSMDHNAHWVKADFRHGGIDQIPPEAPDPVAATLETLTFGGQDYNLPEGCLATEDMSEVQCSPAGLTQLMDDYRDARVALEETDRPIVVMSNDSTGTEPVPVTDLNRYSLDIGLPGRTRIAEQCMTDLDFRIQTMQTMTRFNQGSRAALNIGTNLLDMELEHIDLLELATARLKPRADSHIDTVTLAQLHAQNRWDGNACQTLADTAADRRSAGFVYIKTLLHVLEVNGEAVPEWIHDRVQESTSWMRTNPSPPATPGS